jgi:ATP-dependent helicase/nuclease subunit B
MPPVEIVTGTLAELEDALAEAIRRARADDRLAPVTVLVGHVLLKRYLPRTLAARGIAHLNVRFLRPNELAEELSPEADTDRARLTPAAERMLVRDVASTAGGYFAGITGGDGFSDALLRLFRELELGGFGSPVALERALGEGDGDGNREKFAALAHLYGRFLAARSSARLIAPAERYAMAGAGRFEGPLLVYGLWTPSELQMRLIERIAAERTVTAFFANAELDADDAHAAFRDRLLAGGAAERRLGATGTTTAIDRLASALFRDSSEAVEAPNVSLLSAPDTVREVWEAARACLAWAREGIRFHEMAVVYRNRDPYRALVDEIFREAGIGAYVHDGRLLSAHPLGVRLLALLDLAADPAFSRQAVMEFLTETRLPRRTAEQYGRFRPSEWETYTREAGVVGGIEQWHSRLRRLAAEKTERAKDERFAWMAGDAGRIADLERFAEDFHAALTAHGSDGATWDEHLAYLRELAASYADGVEPIIEALGDLRTLGAVAPRVSFEVFRRAVHDDLETRDVSGVLGEPVRMFGREGVAVVDATSLRHLRFRAVYMLGVAERAWPAPPRPDPLLLEHERSLLNGAGPGAVPLRTEPDDEPLTFWLGVQAAREHVRLSYARSDAGGSGKHLPSYFFRAVAEVLNGRPLTLAELDASPHVRRVEAGRLAHDDLSASLSRAEYDRGLVRTAIASGDSAPIDALAAGTATFGRAVQARLSRWSSSLTAYDGVMTGGVAIARAAETAFARVKPVSPSRLETYAICPYRYFVRYTLGVDAVTEPEETERIDALERGSLIHAILERFLQQIGRDDPPRPEARARHVELLQRVAAEEGREREARGVTGRPLIWEMDQRQIGDDLVRWYAAEVKEAAQTSLRPGAFEVGFGGARFGFGEESPLSTEEPVAVRAGDRDLLLQGRIDRIDWDDARQGFRVIDYKTGKVRGNAKATFDKGRALQLPVYLHAAAAALGMDAAQGEAQYFYVSSGGGYRRKNVTGEELAEKHEQLEQIFTTIVDGVDGGFFAPNPGGKARPNCAYCEAKDICDANVGRIAERKLGDRRGAAYRALEDIE